MDAVSSGRWQEVGERERDGKITLGREDRVEPIGRRGEGVLHLFLSVQDWRSI
jgi:hypothetical protein